VWLYTELTSLTHIGLISAWVEGPGKDHIEVDEWWRKSSIKRKEPFSSLIKRSYFEATYSSFVLGSFDDRAKQGPLVVRDACEFLCSRISSKLLRKG